jgi:hypothetical protein
MTESVPSVSVTPDRQSANLMVDARSVQKHFGALQVLKGITLWCSSASTCSPT